MSESDNTTSSDLEMSGDSSLLESDVDIGAVEPYQDEPLASEISSDSESDADDILSEFKAWVKKLNFTPRNHTSGAVRVRGLCVHFA